MLLTGIVRPTIDQIVGRFSTLFSLGLLRFLMKIKGLKESTNRADNWTKIFNLPLTEIETLQL